MMLVFLFNVFCYILSNLCVNVFFLVSFNPNPPDPCLRINDTRFLEAYFSKKLMSKHYENSM